MYAITYGSRWWRTRPSKGMTRHRIKDTSNPYQLKAELSASITISHAVFSLMRPNAEWDSSGVMTTANPSTFVPNRYLNQPIFYRGIT